MALPSPHHLIDFAPSTPTTANQPNQATTKVKVGELIYRMPPIELIVMAYHYNAPMQVAKVVKLIPEEVNGAWLAETIAAGSLKVGARSLVIDVAEPH
ncbi:hypothetical protein NQ176_g7221 [Zarea fungicola]|uniref:Uncharacterized protein n=1 Tax=Zarea fungicola TaxID=93591 RepID=A0ACC1MZZ0_9HYPO|nr:hypothetical protein NQ176_g7221 [Lecanicillium fungicola]